ncbi:MAG TPA: zinc-dependent metalloprotease [Acidimicrobiales bacterium]|nr:zinc-dependent metalloprotease [Acidimicrobiales bacterium]
MTVGATESGLVSWEVALRVASRIAGRQPWVPPGRLAVLEEDFNELTGEAESLVERATGLRSLVGPARARVTDRPGWVEANISSFQRLLRPLTQKLDAAIAKPAPMIGPVPLRVPPRVSRNLSGAQVGLMLGWMSTRVLGQYDQLLIEDERPEDQDIVYYVGPNIVELEDRHGFQPREFRLWLALHEVTHRAQFTGVPWLRPHFLSLVESVLAGIEPDPKHFIEALKHAASEAREGRNPLHDGGLVALLATPEQRQALDRVGGFMSLLEGHGDVIMNRAGKGRILEAPRFARILQQRRQRRGAAKVVSSLVGLEAKLKQYEQGERFVESVEGAGGRELFDRLWQGPEWLPSLVEIRQPSLWIERVEVLGKTA